jgi:hypothetical protein
LGNQRFSTVKYFVEEKLCGFGRGSARRYDRGLAQRQLARFPARDFSQVVTAVLLKPGCRSRLAAKNMERLIGLARGILKLRTALGPADTAIMHFAHPVFWLGFVPTLFKQPRRAAASAKTQVWLLRVPKTDTQKDAQGEPQWWEFFCSPWWNMATLASQLPPTS